MSTEIKDTDPDYGPHTLAAMPGGAVDLVARKSGDVTTATFDRADFLAAVEAELGVIVIDRADLPPIDRTDINAGLSGQVIRTVLTAGDAPPAKDAAAHRARALGHLALAEYLDAPPIDERQWNGVTDALREAAEAEGGCYDGWDYAAVARALVARGVRVEVTP